VEPRWEQAGLVRVIARTQTGEITTQAFFELTGEPATATLSPLTTPTDTTTASSPTPPTDTVPGPTSPGQPSPSPEPVEARAIATADVNVRTGPGTNYAVLGVMRTGQSARVTGIAPDGNWWQIEFSGVANGRGWISAQFVAAQQIANVPLVQPPALPATATPLPPTSTATPAPPVITEWRGEYFDNPNLSGPPVLVRNDPAVRFSWGPNSPGPGVPADNFSARWIRDIHFSAGTYRFKVLVDDGARLWVDDHLIIDRWRTGPPESFYGEITLSEGTHRVRLEYFEYIYDAQVHLEWERIGESEGSLPDFPEWRAEYFDNRNVEGVPVLVRNESRIAHNWGSGSPNPAVPADNFSARWLRQVELPSGTYGMRVTVDDGVRVWINDVLFIDSWQSGEARTVETEGHLGSGRHWLRVEYFERTGQALINVEWFRKG
jgi:hypothetical protein